VGLRPAHYPALDVRESSVEFFEIIAQNYLVESPAPRRHLDRVAAKHAIVLHSVGMNVLGHEPLDYEQVDAIATLARDVGAPFVTDHLCWTGAHAMSHHDLLPVPHVPELVDYAVARIERLKARLPVAFGVENVTSYVDFRSSTMPEYEFLSRVARDADCGILLDVNNVFVSTTNHGLDATKYLEAIDFDRVLLVHLAGHAIEPDGTLVDTHDTHVRAEVWELYRRAWTLGGPFPTLIEWDAKIPPFEVLEREADRAREERRGVDLSLREPRTREVGP
jgi:uncharacterized protein (UPF0276 family)